MTQNITVHTDTPSPLPSTNVTPPNNLLSRIFLFIHSKLEAFCACILSISFVNYLLVKFGLLDVTLSPTQFSENTVPGAAALVAKWKQIQTDPFVENLDLSQQNKWLEAALIKDSNAAMDKFADNRYATKHITLVALCINETGITDISSLIYNLKTLIATLFHHVSSPSDQSVVETLQDNVETYSTMHKLIHDLKKQENAYANAHDNLIETYQQIDDIAQPHEISCRSDFQNVLINMCKLPLYETRLQLYQAELDHNETKHKLSFIKLMNLITSIGKQDPATDDLDVLATTLQNNSYRHYDAQRKRESEERFQLDMSEVYQYIITNHYKLKGSIMSALSTWKREMAPMFSEQEHAHNQLEYQQQFSEHVRIHITHAFKKLRQTMIPQEPSPYQLEPQPNFVEAAVTHIRHAFDTWKPTLKKQEQNEQRLHQIEQWFQDINLTISEDMF